MKNWRAVLEELDCYFKVLAALAYMGAAVVFAARWAFYDGGLASLALAVALWANAGVTLHRRDHGRP